MAIQYYNAQKAIFKMKTLTHRIKHKDGIFLISLYYKSKEDYVAFRFLNRSAEDDKKDINGSGMIGILQINKERAKLIGKWFTKLSDKLK